MVTNAVEVLRPLLLLLQRHLAGYVRAALRRRHETAFVVCLPVDHVSNSLYSCFAARRFTLCPSVNAISHIEICVHRSCCRPAAEKPAHDLQPHSRSEARDDPHRRVAARHARIPVSATRVRPSTAITRVPAGACASDRTAHRRQSVMTTRDVSVDQLRDENSRLRRQLVRLRAANEELSEDNGHLRGSAICWRKLYEAALQSLGDLRPRA